MSTGTTHSPNLPVAPVEYSQRYQDTLNNILRLYFTQLDSPGPCAMSTLYRGATINSALNFSDTNPLGVRVVSLPTQADVSSLRAGDVYYDTTAGNVLKVKT